MIKIFLPIIIALIITGCGGQSYKGIKGAKPRYEPLSKSGNPATYKALGKKYKVMNTSKGYKEKGYASWYGKDFHGKRTSSGTPYNMHTYSAAHKTLPIPTYVLVTNLENRKQLVLRVDDRGPFVSGRIIDLSYKAAQELGVVGKGTAKVSVEALAPYQSLKNAKGIASVPPTTQPLSSRPQQPAVQQPPITPSGSDYALQLGAFGDHNNANNFSHTITPSINQPVKVHFDGRLYRVLAGSYTDRNAAEHASFNLKQSGFTNAIYQIR